MRFFKRFSALLLAAALVLGLAACSGNGGDAPAEFKLTRAEEDRIISLARAFRIYGEFDGESGFELRQFEYLVYSLTTCELSESDVAGYGRVSLEEADELVNGVLGGKLNSAGLIRTKYKANEIQVIYAIGDYYYVMRTDDGAYTYTISSAWALTDDDGARTGVAALVTVSGGESEFKLAFELLDSETSVFSVRKCEIQNTI